MTLVKIVWLDACKQIDVSQNSFDLMERAESDGTSDGTGFLTKNETSGELYKIYDEVILLIQDKNEEERDIYAIPRSWIISPKKYRISPRKNIRK